MDAFKETLLGLRDAFMQMPLPTRVIGSALVVVIAMGLWLVVSQTGTSAAMERLFPGEALSDDEIKEVLGAFSSNRLNGWNVEHNHVYVPKDNRDEYWRAVVEANAVPWSSRNPGGGADGESSIFDSQAERDRKWEQRKKMEVAAQIEQLKEVRRASVEHDEETSGMFHERRESASVLVTPEGSAPLSAAIVKKIEQYIRNAYAMKQTDEVVVIDINATDAGTPGDEDPLLRITAQWEEYYRTKAQRQFAHIDGLRVQATVQVDPTMDVQKVITKIDQQPVGISENTSQTTHESSRTLPGGTPGLATNQFQGAGNQPRSIDNPPTQTVKSTQKSENVQRVAGEEMETKREAAFQPTRVTFSVGIPKTYFEDLWRKQYAVTNPDATDGTPTVPANELAKLEMTIQDEMQKALAPLLPPVEAGEDKYPLVEVWAYDELPVAPAATAGAAEQALTWLADSWQALALLGLALCALWVARSVGKSVGAPRQEFEEGFGLELPKPPEAPEEDVLDNSGGPMLEITGLTLQKDLHRLVENNPEAAANVLRNWLDGEAA